MIKTILIGYDEGEPAKRALERAAQLAKALDAKLVVTSVAPVTTTATARSIGTDPLETSADHRAELHDAHVYLESVGLTADYIEAVGHEADSILEARARARPT